MAYILSNRNFQVQSIDIDPIKNLGQLRALHTYNGHDLRTNSKSATQSNLSPSLRMHSTHSTEIFEIL